MKRAKIWTSVPHEVDGIYVELIEEIGKKKLAVQTDSTWLPTVEECRAWALAQGASVITER